MLLAGNKKCSYRSITATLHVALTLPHQEGLPRITHCVPVRAVSNSNQATMNSEQLTLSLNQPISQYHHYGDCTAARVARTPTITTLIRMARPSIVVGKARTNVTSLSSAKHHYILNQVPVGKTRLIMVGGVECGLPCTMKSAKSESARMRELSRGEILSAWDRARSVGMHR